MISINGHILENTLTTAQWAARTTALPARTWGHEYANDGITPIGSKMGDGSHLWANLPYWYGGTIIHGVRKSFTTDSVTTQYNINWQTDTPTGFTQTYYQLFGNFVEGQWIQLPVGAGIAIMQGSSNMSYTLDGSGNVLIVTIDCGPNVNAYVRFG